MQVSLPILHHPKDGYAIDLNRLIDVTKVLKKRDTDSGDRDFCVYVFEDEFGIERYHGMGRYGDIAGSKGSKSRPFNHKNDLLSKCINSKGTCRIVAIGLTSKEAHIVEAQRIKDSSFKLTKPGTKEWDRESLINKRRERKWERLITEYLNLGNGNNTRFAA